MAVGETRHTVNCCWGAVLIHSSFAAKASAFSNNSFNAMNLAKTLVYHCPDV